MLHPVVGDPVVLLDLSCLLLNGCSTSINSARVMFPRPALAGGC